MLLDITGFLGHLHPLAVHLPIGFLLLAVLFNLISYYKRYAYLKAAVGFTLLAGFVSALASCVFGWLLSLGDGYDAATLYSHKIAGIGLTLIAGLLYWLETGSVHKRLKPPAFVFSAACLGLSVLMAYAGHQGGSLTHGSNYLTLETLTKERRPRPVNAGEAFIFEDVVHPMLESRCGQCHQSGRLKGKLSVATLAGLLKGGKHGPAVVPGKLTESELFTRITLNPGNEAYMPSDGKTPLTSNEVEIIRWWIDKAMAAEGRTVASFKDSAAIAPRVAVYLGLNKTLPAGDGDVPAQQINPAIPATADTAAIRILRNAGLMVRVMLQHPVMLDISLPAGADIKIAGIEPALQRVAGNIVWLNLSGNNYTDADVRFLARCVNIEKLRLERNPVTDSISNTLAALSHLQSVNLNDTRMTARGLEVLKKNPSLKSIYTWHTAIP